MKPNPPRKLVRHLQALEQQLAAVPHQYQLLLRTIHPANRTSAINLLQYLVLRSQDITGLQDQLHHHGLSSLTSSESHVHRQIQEVLARLGQPVAAEALNTCDAREGAANIRRHAKALFGAHTSGKEPAFMVTLDAEMANDPSFLESLLHKGMQLARINCAHDEPKTWKKILRTLRQAARKTGRSCKLYMDLAGPKFRIVLKSPQEIPGRIPVSAGERIRLVEPGARSWPANEKVIACHQPHVLQALRPGATVLFDDGIMEGVIQLIDSAGAVVQLTRLSGKPWIKAGKGINFPGTPIMAEALTEGDLASLPFIAGHAHLVGFSFVKTPADIRSLRQQLGGEDALDQAPWIIIKIETPEAVAQLPALLLEGLAARHAGVMIARGDLAVEIGFERLGEIQEEILWLCEAAHMPVIWATQVLEQLNKTGVASRSEITDAYKAAQAECIMVNKGAHTGKVLHTLKDVARRSRRHHLKKRYALPPLAIARQFAEPPVEAGRKRKNPSA
jgi:pyruvate kinase